MNRIYRTITCSVSRRPIRNISGSTISRTLFVDVSNADFLGNDRHLRVILDALENGFDEGQQYLTLP